MSVTHIQTNIIRLKNEVSNLSVKIADKRKRAALAMEKANKANVEALKAKSVTIAKNKKLNLKGIIKRLLNIIKK